MIIDMKTPVGSIGLVDPDRRPIYVDCMIFEHITPVQDQGDCSIIPFLMLYGFNYICLVFWYFLVLAISSI